MSDFAYTKTYDDNHALTEAMLDTTFDSVQTFINGRNQATSSWDKLAVAGAFTFTGGVANLFGYRRPNLEFSSVTAVNVENNTGTAHQTAIIFPDGNIRSVTENVGSTNKYRQFIITAAAEFTSGTEDSGLRSGISEATNTWYAIYAVKSTIDSTKFVLAGDTTLPLQANFSTLDGRYGTSGWVYLGLIRNGDNSGSTGDILAFTQAGGIMKFSNGADNPVTSQDAPGTILTSNSNTTSDLIYTYSAGTGTANVPGHISHALYTVSIANQGRFQIESGSQAVVLQTTYTGSPGNPSSHTQAVGPFAASAGLAVTTGANSNYRVIYLSGFVDKILAAGINPLI